MQIGVGKRYVRRDRSLSGVLTDSGDAAFPFHDKELIATYTEEGIRGLGPGHWSDLVAEYVEPVSPSEVSGKESTVEYDLSGIPAGYEFVGYRFVQVGDQYVGNVGGQKVYVATESDVTLKKLRLIVKPIEPKQRTVVIHKWLVWDLLGKERMVFGTEKYIGDCGFSDAVDLGFYEEVKVSV